jgi:hypothetical protein
MKKWYPDPDCNITKMNYQGTQQSPQNTLKEKNPASN